MDGLAIANFVVTVIVGICASYLAFAQLQHAARPKVTLRLTSHRQSSRRFENAISRLGKNVHFCRFFEALTGRRPAIEWEQWPRWIGCPLERSINGPLRYSVDHSNECTFVFALSNVGSWYARPPATDVIVFINFDPAFALIEMRYGADQSYSRADPKIGVGGMKYFKAKGLKLTYGDPEEQIHVRVKSPDKTGVFRVKISGSSENGVSLRTGFVIYVV